MRTRINGLSICVGVALLAVAAANAPHLHAQSASTQDMPPAPEALPPPPMDDPGTPAPATPEKAAKRSAETPPPLPPESSQDNSAPTPAVADKSAALDAAAPQLTSTDPTPPKPSITHSAANSPTLSAADARLTGEPNRATIRTMDNGDRIEEYRSGGQLTRVKVTPAKGPSYEILDANGDGHLDQKDAPNGVQPVGWTLFKWH